MVFKCQEDSFLKEFTSIVIKCEETKEPIIEYGKVSKFEGYQVILDNTILFPAGGGQPHDIGYLNDKKVLQVLRKGNEALHFTKEPLPVGTKVTQKIDWNRRFDHMQQHSGQHLLSAILEQEHLVPTTSWWLGAEESNIELDASKVTESIIWAVERRCNDLIREALPVVVKFCKIDDPQLSEVHTRGLPKDCVDTIRIICIGDIDENMCCGTHVSNLSQLQMIKLLGTESGKKGKVNLRFLVGDRITTTLQTMLRRETVLCSLLKSEPKNHEDLIQKMSKNLKITSKNLQNVLMDLAKHETQAIRAQDPLPAYVFMFKKEATPEYYTQICKQLEGLDIFLFLASEDNDRPKEGRILIQGSQEHWDALGTQLAELVKCKGAFVHGKFQGKAGDLGGINKCKKLIEKYFSSIK